MPLALRGLIRGFLSGTGGRGQAGAGPP